MNFIEQKIQDIRTATQQFTDAFSDMDAASLDVKPDAERWSINECMDHIVQANASYFESFKAARDNRLPSNLWSKIPGLPAFWGNMIYKAVSPEYQKKTKTFKVWYPRQSNYGRSVLPDLISGNETLINHFKSFHDLDLDALIITSPAGKFITYTLRMAITILAAHEFRHFNQAAAVKVGLKANLKTNLKTA